MLYAYTISKHAHDGERSVVEMKDYKNQSQV